MEKNLMVDSIRSYEVLKDVYMLKKGQLICKRMFDIIFSFLLILILSPLLILTAFLIKITSRGSVLYDNYRIGLNGEYFKCYKFRSMVISSSVHESEQKNGVLYKQKNDNRITTVGKFIRKTSIDELPQLFNVIKGDMSIVGPRPLIPFMLVPYPEFSKVRCLVRPGITGLWQIKDREHNTSAEFMFKYDIEYLDRCSFLLDIKIIFSTPLVVISGKGAY